MKSNFSISALTQVFNDSSSDVRSKIIGMYILLISINIVIWIVALLSFSGSLLLLGTGLAAYAFGMRHAVDADHISAVDNVTRKLMQDNKRPVAVGFFFALGHSTIVTALSVGVAIAASLVSNFDFLRNIGGVIGTTVSAVFLYVIAIINLLVLWEIFQTFQRVKRGEEYSDQTLNEFLSKRGLMGRFFKPLLKVVSHSWNMYPIGLLFGLGFDTATQVALLAIAAASGTRGLPFWTILIFPLLFAAGMSLMDTTDGILMLGAYGWAFVKPMRKLYYNLNITLVSVLVALIVGTIEALSILSSQLGLSGGVWRFIGNLSENFGIIGYIIIGVFIASWGISTIIYKVNRYDDIQIKIAPKSDELFEGGGE
jgi:high-affinity nickel-transport protein